MPTRGTQQKPVPVCSLGFRAYDILGTGSGNGINDVTGNGQSGSNESLVARPLARNIYVPCLVGICVVGIYVVLTNAPWQGFCGCEVHVVFFGG